MGGGDGGGGGGLYRDKKGQLVSNWILTSCQNPVIS